MRDLIKCGDCGGGNFAVFHEKSPEDSRVGGKEPSVLEAT